jgi:hypothetical protein
MPSTGSGPLERSSERETTPKEQFRQAKKRQNCAILLGICSSIRDLCITYD